VTAARPIAAPVPPRRRWGLLLGSAVVIAVIAWLALGGIGDALVYYQTPTELLARENPIGQTVRLGGQVKQGSIDRTTSHITFVLTDGTTDVTVVSDSLPTSSFREGSGAVVEGSLNGEGTFEAQQILVKHDENYVAPSEGGVPSHIPDGG
jgi:cytochrome c-type biogenesis protein CcmE